MTGINRYISKRPLPPNAPKFIIAGAQKAGTSALYEYLSKHPQLIAQVPKELHYFNCEKRFSKGIDYYHSLFTSPKKNSQMTFDASAGYLHNDSAFKRIYEYNPEIKIIVLVRQPVERAFSAWNMYKKLYLKNRDWFEEWVSSCCSAETKFLKRSESSLFNFKEFVSEEIDYIKSNSSVLLETPIISHGLYAIQLSRYLSLFDRDQILIIDSSEFIKKTIPVLHNIESFIGISAHSWDEYKLGPVFKGIYTDSIDDETRETLSTYYASHNERLFELTGIQY